MTTIDSPIIWASVQQTLSQLSLPTPPELREEMQAIDKTLEQRDVLKIDPEAVTNRAADLLALGKDPAEDKAFQALLARHHMADLGLYQRLETMADKRRGQSLAKHAEAIIAQLCEAVTHADTVLTEARESIRNLDLRDDRFVAGLRPDQMAKWGAAREQAERVSTAEALWRELVLGLSLADIPGTASAVLILADLNHTQTQQLAGGRPYSVSVTDIIQAGHHLQMASVSEYHRRLNRVRKQRQSQQSARDEQRQRDHGMAKPVSGPLHPQGAHL